MSVIKHILFPHDLSEQASQAAPFVRVIACAFGARITALSVIPPVWTAPPVGMAPLLTMPTPEMERELDLRLGQELVRPLDGVTFDHTTLSGDPAYKIVEFASTNGVDLIMMPTHGCGLFRSLLIGSTTAKVLHDTTLPVWTSAHKEKQHANNLPRTILCAVDGSPGTVELAQWACWFSQRLGAKLQLLHVVPPISDWLALASERELQEQVRDEARANVEALRKAAGVDAPLRVAVGKIAEMVAEEARQEGADLVLIGRGAVQAPLGRLRTHAYQIIQQSPCPVLSV